MQIILQNAGKRFNRDWIFRKVDLTFVQNTRYAITGPNGSGKSTLLQLIGGAIQPSEGKITCMDENGKPIADWHREISIAAPYLELIEELTAPEHINFHRKFKNIALSNEEVLESAGLTSAAGKEIRYFSSGMKQRLKLALAFFSSSRLLLLDEPQTNLDEEGIALYHKWIHSFASNRIVIISSNEKQEYTFCEKIIDMKTLKP